MLLPRYYLRFPESYINQRVSRVSAVTFIFWDQEDIDDRESCEYYWETYLYSFLSDLRVPAAVSPRHNMDIDFVDVDSGLVHYKKTHWHVVLDYGTNKKTVKQIYEELAPIRKYISIAPFDSDDYDFSVYLNNYDLKPEYVFTDLDDDDFKKIRRVWLKSNVVRNMRSLLRYFKHLDNPEKYQYSGDIISFGGFDVEDRIYSQTDSLVIIDDILDFVVDNNIYSFRKLVDYCRKENREWYSVIYKSVNTNFITSYLKSFTVENTGYLDRKIQKYESSD